MGKSGWVIWSDVGNVIAPFDLERYFVNLAAFTGMDFALVKQRLVDLPSAQQIHWGILTGEVTMEEYRRGVELLLGKQLPEAKFWPIFSDIFRGNPRLIRVYRHLRRTRQVKRIILMTDADPKRLKHALKLCDFEPDDIVASYAVGRRKPDPAMFKKGIELAACDPDCIIYIDDLLENVLAAREFGVISLHYLFDSVGQRAANDIVIGELSAMGLSV